MKKQFLFTCLFCLLVNMLLAQSTISLRFTGVNANNGTFVELNRVEINNISRTWTEILTYPDTTLILSCGSTGLNDYNRNITELLNVSAAVGGDGFVLDITMEKAGNAQIEIFDIAGRRVLHVSNNLPAGVSSYHLQLPSVAAYIVKTTTPAGTCTEKVLNSYAAAPNFTFVGTKIITDKKATSSIRGFSDKVFVLGDVLQYVAYAEIDGVSYTSQTILQPQNGDETFTMMFDVAQGGNYFSVAQGVSVAFSMGNLQYQASTNSWRFAEEQWLYLSTENEAISAQNSGWIDLFGWGTSGWDCGNTFFQPYDNASGEANGLLYGPQGMNDITGAYANSDWGGYAAIGDYPAGTWRTLSSDEWQYLLEGRPRAEQLSSQATVNNTYGFIFLPDNWTTPAGVSFTGRAGNWTTNTYTSTSWQTMEAAGAIFLPAAGRRNESTFEGAGTGGYWSATCSNNFASDARYFFFNVQEMGWHEYFRSTGRSVRLVRNL